MVLYDPVPICRCINSSLYPMDPNLVVGRGLAVPPQRNFGVCSRGDAGATVTGSG